MLRPSFKRTLAGHGIELLRERPRVLQLNTGYLCNLSCRHCHLRAGPERKEVMSLEVMELAVEYARRHGFECLDITGGAPELVPGIEYLIKALSGLAPKLIWRTNLLALAERPDLQRLLAELKYEIVGSLPATSRAQTESMRGVGVFEASLAALGKLNALGYGVEDGLELHLASNPCGAFIPPGQDAACTRFKRDLARHGLSFNSLYVFANVPLGRFRDFLERSGNLEPYMSELYSRFNPSAVNGVMCKSMLSVGFDGRLYACDFNQAADLSLPGLHLRDMVLPEPGSRPEFGEHCFACTAGSGFT